MIEFKNIKSVDENISKLNKITKAISIIRLILALSLLTFLICLFSLQETALYSALSISVFILFIIFILFTNKYFKRLEHFKNKKEVYESHNRRRNLNFNKMYDLGEDFITKDDYKLLDLDIFGPKSLFQYLSVCKTKNGRSKLAKRLSSIHQSENINLEREAVFELAEREDTLDIEASFKEFSNDAKTLNYDEFLSVTKSKIAVKPLFFIPLISFLGMITYLILVFTININPLPLIAFLLLNFITCKYCLNNDVFLLNSIKYYHISSAYLEIADIIKSIKYQNVYLNQLQSNISKYYEPLKKLNKIYLALSTRNNIIAKIILNSLFIYDLYLIFIFNKLHEKIIDLEILFDSISEFEVLISLANIGLDNDVYSIPTFSDNIIAKNMKHPLLKDCVDNDFTLSGGVVLTGSNMSGKTTFMRTLGINQILFNAGGITLSKSFSSSYLPIYTSLRANDLLSEGISTFYAEILRMKTINNAIKENKCLILIDEIFKGTNAYERINASFKVIDKLNSYNAYFIISTHDFELCDANNILNYHFNEEYNDDKISFDYKIKEGKCTSKNALYLLKMTGIIE